MFKIIFIILLSSLAIQTKASNKFEKRENIKIYNSNSSISKVVFNIAEVASSETTVPINVSFQAEKVILEKISGGEKVDLLITDSYELLKDLKELGFIDFSETSELFFDRLVFISFSRNEKTENFETQESEAIFFKTSMEDKEIINDRAEKIPSVLIDSSNVCKKINSLRVLYENSYQYLIIKESVAKKCEFYYSGFFDNLYNLYYIAIVKNENFNKTKKTFDFLENSDKIKEIIKNNGYNR
jgi:ABC-type molybdate transport system substrate-binding protein